MSSKSKKKIKPQELAEEKVLPDPVCKKYILCSPDVSYSTATYRLDRVAIVHNQGCVQVIDTGNGYHIHDVNPGGTHTYYLDYAVAADFFAALKIFYYNADKVNGEYWTIFQGEKL